MMMEAFVLIRIQKEYNSFIAGEENDFCVYCMLKNIDQSLALPCRHDFKNKTVNFNVKQTFFKSDLFNDISDGKVTYSRLKTQPKSFKYTDIIAKISPYEAVADRNAEIQQIFTDIFDQLDQVQGSIQNRGIPPINSKCKISSSFIKKRNTWWKA